MDFQPRSITNLDNKFGNMVGTLRVFKTLGTPGISLVQNHDYKYLSVQDNKVYQLRVGMLLYLGGGSRPDIANTVQELSKVLDWSLVGSFNEMIRIIDSILNTHNFGINTEPENLG